MPTWPVAAVILLFFSAEECAGITCFYCTVQPSNSRTNQTPQLCSAFDHSNNFHKDCPLSTLCMKRTFQLTLQEGKTVKVSERGCAPQSRDDHVFRDGKWHTENKIEGDVYQVGCEPSETPGVQSSTEYCYCATNLCNAADGPRDHIDTMAVIFAFNILKYIQSMR